IAILALLIVALPFVTGLFGPAVSILPHDPNELLPCAIPTECATPPSAQYWFGTDNVGRDMFSRVLAALPLDLAIGFGVAGFALLVGTGLGLVAGFWDTPGTLGGALSIAIMRITDMFLAFPSLVLALAIAASLGRGTGPALIAIMITWWPFYVRLLLTAPWTVLAPGAAIFLTVLAFSLLGDGLRDILDPRSRRALVQTTTAPGLASKGAAEA